VDVERCEELADTKMSVGSLLRLFWVTEVSNECWIMALGRARGEVRTRTHSTL
jgi:hypothetical protein